MLEQSNAFFGMFGAETEIFYALLFAYIIAMYLAGSQLTRLQYVIANTMYLLVMANTIFACFNLLGFTFIWLEYAGLQESTEASTDWIPITTATLRLALVILSMWFGRRIRHPKVE